MKFWQEYRIFCKYLSEFRTRDSRTVMPNEERRTWPFQGGDPGHAGNQQDQVLGDTGAQRKI